MIEEDDEKVTITMKPRGSGERIIEMAGTNRLGPGEGAGHITRGMRDFPIYCVHCPVVRC